MEGELDHLVYSKTVLEFVTVGNEYCNQLENAYDRSAKELFTVVVRILPLLYVKALVLPKTEFVLDENIEKTVREEDYIRVQHTLLNKFGEFDDYLEVFVPDNDMEQEEVASSISENLTDIYQDVKDFLFAYRIGVTDIMNDALVELVNSFEMYWGQKLVNVLRLVIACCIVVKILMGSYMEELKTIIKVMIMIGLTVFRSSGMMRIIKF